MLKTTKATNETEIIIPLLRVEGEKEIEVNMEPLGSLLPPSFEGGDLSPFPSSPSTTDSASGSPDKDVEDSHCVVKKALELSSLTSTPIGKAPPNSALTTPDMKTPSGLSSTEVSAQWVETMK